VSSEIDLHVYQGQSFDDARGCWVMWLSVSLQDARSRGRVRLASAEPAAPPVIDHAYFVDPVDLENLCDGVELVTRLIATPPLSAMVMPMPELAGRWRDRDGLRAFVRAHVGTTFHPSSTCAMGPNGDPLAVVDHVGRVLGVDGLRVVDASIFPTGPRCNLHFPTVMAAERIASAIQQPDADTRRQA
jgi:choline dehydrogenase